MKRLRIYDELNSFLKEYFPNIKTNEELDFFDLRESKKYSEICSLKYNIGKPYVIEMEDFYEPYKFINKNKDLFIDMFGSYNDIKEIKSIVIFFNEYDSNYAASTFSFRIYYV